MCLASQITQSSLKVSHTPMACKDMATSPGIPGRDQRKVSIMRALRLTAAALVLAALSTLGVSAAQADVTAAPKTSVVQLSGWQW